MSSSFTFERESILRPSIDCLFKATEKEQREKIQTDSSITAAATVEKLWNFVCCRACRIAAHTNKLIHTHQHRHTPKHIHMLLSIASHTHVTVLKTHLDTGQQAKNNLQNERKKKQLNSRWFPPCRNTPLHPFCSTASCPLDCCNETSNFVAIKT